MNDLRKTKAQLIAELAALRQRVAELETRSAATPDRAEHDRAAQLAERLDLATRSAHLGIWDWDIQRNELVWDDAMYALYGLRPGEFGGAYEAWLRGLHPDDRAASDAVSQRARDGEGDYDTEFRVVWPDGSVHWLKANGLVFRDEQGAAVRMVGVNYDITERKHAEAAVRASEELFRAAIEFLPIPLAVADVAGRIVHLNQRFTEQYGYTLPDLPTIDAWMQQAYPDPAYRAEVAANWPRRIADSVQHDRPTPTREFSVTGKDGRQHIVEITARGLQGLIIVSFNDITERKRTEAELREARELFQTMFNTSPVPTALSRISDRTIVDVNAAMENLLGFTRAELAGKPSLNFDYWADAQQRQRAFEILLREGTLRDFEFTFKTKLGATGQALNYTELFEQHGDKYLLSVFVDITARKLAEEKLQASERTLKLFVDYAPAAIAMFDRDMRYLAASQRYVADYRLPEADLVGRSHYQVFPETTDRQKAIHQRCLAGAVEKNDGHPFVRADGTVEWVRWEIHPWYEATGEIGGIIFFSEVITARKQAEQELQRWADTFQNVVFGFVIGSPDSQNLGLMNPAFARMHGYTPEELSGASIVSVFAPESRADLPEHIRLTHEQGHHAWEAKHLRKDGTVFPVLVDAAAVKDADGKILYRIVSVQDITERKQAEEALRESEAKLRTLFELLPVGVSILDSQRRLVYANPAVERILEVNVDDLRAGRHSQRQFLRPDRTPMPPAEFASVRAVTEGHAVYGIETGVVKEDGGIIWTSVSAVPVNYSDWKVVIVTTDITARKTAEEALRLSQENFAKAFALNPAALVITRLTDGCFIQINAAHTQMLGYEPDELIGRLVSDLNMYVDPNERAELTRQLRETGSVNNRELRLRVKSGAVRNMLTYMTTLRFDGEDCILSALLDITDRKRAEQDLHDAVEELRRSNAELEQFAYVASHDLQEPLRAVAGMVQLLEQRYKDQLDARANEYIHHAVDAANRMQALITDLLAFSRAGRRGRPLEPVNPRDHVNAALKNLEVAVQESGAVITVDALPVITADSAQLTQLFQNLIGNALKFRSQQTPHIHVSAQQQGEAWQFAVRDNGLGIEPQYFERIFQVFQRLHTRREYAGTGIGLALCKKIVERHGGQIWVESTPGQGSTFYFTIPIRS